jgi:hypothetical protein
MDSAGYYITGIVTGGYIYVSQGGPVNQFITVGITAQWKSIVVSSNGQYQCAASSNVGIYYSNNFGSVWFKSSAPNDLYSGLSMDPTGVFVNAIINGQVIYLVIMV